MKNFARLKENHTNKQICRKAKFGYKAKQVVLKKEINGKNNTCNDISLILWIYFGFS